MKYQNKPISGGTVNLYKVGDVREDDGNYSFVPVAAIKGTIPAFGDIQSPELAEDLAKLKDKLIAVTETPVTVGGNGKKGIAEFRNLSFGLYLVALKGQTVMMAFSVSLCTGIALLVSILLSSICGTAVPLAFKKMNVDPAVASGPLITTINDLVAVVSYYGLAWLLLIRVLHL